MKNWINNRPPDWKNPCPRAAPVNANRYFNSGFYTYEAGADAMYKAVMMEMPYEEEWRLKILDIEFGEISVPEFIQWLKDKSLVRGDDTKEGDTTRA